jgi:hypothetical protein
MRFVDLIPESIVESDIVTQLRLKSEASKNPDRVNAAMSSSLGLLLGLGISVVIWKNNTRAFSK